MSDQLNASERLSMMINSLPEGNIAVNDGSSYTKSDGVWKQRKKALDHPVRDFSNKLPTPGDLVMNHMHSQNRKDATVDRWIEEIVKQD